MRETAAGSRRPTWSSSWRVTAGASTASPAATARTASTTSRVGASLSRKPLAPARSASMMYSSSPKVVRMSTRWRGSRRVASMPSMPGMRMSISTTSGRCASAAATASSPVAASATTSIEPVASSTALKPARIIGWSSAMTTRSAAHDAPP